MIGKIIGFFKSTTYKTWFLSSAGYFMSSSTCPFCGKPGCPGGLGIAAAVGGIFISLGLGIKKLKALIKRSRGLGKST
jgi:membrane associated rhomboid family serine protease